MEYNTSDFVKWLFVDDLCSLFVNQDTLYNYLLLLWK